MSRPTAPDTVTLLGEHEFQLDGVGESHLPQRVSCTCGRWRASAKSLPDAHEAHRAHVAAALDAHYAERERAAAEKALRHAAERLPFLRLDQQVAWLNREADLYRRTEETTEVTPPKVPHGCAPACSPWLHVKPCALAAHHYDCPQTIAAMDGAYTTDCTCGEGDK